VRASSQIAPALALALAFGCRGAPQVGDLQQVDPARSEVYGAGLLFASTNAVADWHGAMVIDGEGRQRWVRDNPPEEVLRVRRAGDDSLLVMLDSSADADGRVQRESLDGEVSDVIIAPEVHHDVLELPDGRWAWLEHVSGDAPLQGDPAAPISTDVVMVAEPGGEPEPLFSLFDDYPVEPWWVCSHMELGIRVRGHHQWTHSNSLALDPTRRDELLILARNLDAVLAVDWRTGTFLEQLGGRDSDAEVLDGAALGHPHMSQVTDDGHLLVFDNGLHAEGPSRVVELARGPEGLEVVWSVDHPDGGSVGYLGDARRLPGGNTLVVWSADARLTEVTPSGAIVWDLVLDDTKHIGRTELWVGALP